MKYSGLTVKMGLITKVVNSSDGAAVHMRHGDWVEWFRVWDFKEKVGTARTLKNTSKKV